MSGCQSVEQLSIDYMLPGDISFPSSLRKVAVINNAPQALDGLTAENHPTRQEEDDEIVQATRHYHGYTAVTTESLAQALADENYFDEVVICDSALNSGTKGMNILSRDDVNSLAKNLDVDFLIALEDIQMDATYKIDFMPGWGLFYGTTDVKVYPIVRIYMPNHKNPTVTVSPNDSIFWDATGNSKNDVLSNLIQEKDMIRQASEFAGTVPVKHLLPNWKTAYRYLFTGGSVNMRDASVYAKEGNWENAIALWEIQYNTQKGKKKMKAAYNIALGYEMQDSINHALDWAIKAFNIACEIDHVDNETVHDANVIKNKRNYLLTALYINELQERKNSIHLLNAQMKRFEEE